jgi:RNA polymerase sigma factor (sigma-70 family)
VEELKKLVVHAQAGDLDAYAEVIRRFQDMACGFAYSILGDFHLAEDAAQEAFVQAYRDLSQLREPAAFPGWFRTIVFKHCDRLTRGKRLPAAPIEAAEGVASSHSSPAEAAERSEMKDRVLDAVKSLPPDERMVTTLFYINGYSQKDIADFLEVPVTTVKNRMHASRRLLKERMMQMAQAQLRENAPGERFSAQVIERLLARPRPLEIEGHPVR